MTVPAPGVLANDGDADGDTLSAVLDTDVSQGILDLAAGGSLVYTPTVGFTGMDSFTHYASDGLDNSNVVTVTIHVVAPPAHADYLPWVTE